MFSSLIILTCGLLTLASASPVANAKPVKLEPRCGGTVTKYSTVATVIVYLPTSISTVYTATSTITVASGTTTTTTNVPTSTTSTTIFTVQAPATTNFGSKEKRFIKFTPEDSTIERSLEDRAAVQPCQVTVWVDVTATKTITPSSTLSTASLTYTTMPAATAVITPATVTITSVTTVTIPASCIPTS